MKFLLPLAFGGAVSASLSLLTTMADTMIKKCVPANKGYQDAVLYDGFQKAYELSEDQKYLDWYINQISGPVVQPDGTIAKWNYSKFFLDEYRMGHNYIYLYDQTGEEKYKSAAGIVRHMYNIFPRSPQGAFWHQHSFPNQMWLDGIYMASTFYAKYTHMYDKNNQTAWDDILLQYELIQNAKLENGLLTHGWADGDAPWSDSETGRSPHVWARALGWYFMALVEVQQFFPEEHPGYSKLQKWFTELAASIKSCQDEDTGVWWQVTEDPHPGDEGNFLEGSATAMFAWGFMKAIDLGYLDKDEYLQTAKDAYHGLLANFVKFGPEGTIIYDSIVDECNLIGKVDLDYYYSRPKISQGNNGVGPFMMASYEWETWVEKA